MTKEYVLQGLDCPNCAAKIEASVQKLDGIHRASVNFMTTTLHVEIDGSRAREIDAAVESAVHTHEPDVVVAEKATAKKAAERNEDLFPILRLVAGGAVFAAGLLFSQVSLILFIVAYAIVGYDVLFHAAKNILRGQVFDENFLMSVASLGAFAIGESAEAVGVLLFYQVGELFQDMAVRRSKKSIAGLMDLRPDFARVRRDGELAKVAPESVRIGDVIVVQPGEKIPLDGVVLEGEASLDTSMLTGEAVPRRVSAGDAALSGCLNRDGVLTMRVTQTFGESTASKILDLVENAAAKKAPTENFVTKFARVYTPAVVVLAALIALVPPLFLGAWAEWLHRALLFLVISCPCALVISIPLGFFGGIGGASRRGILVKGGNYLEALANLDLVVFDKTGTLTRGVFEVTAVRPANGFSEERLLEAAARAEAFSNHPIAQSIRRAYDKPVEREGLTEYVETAGYGVSVRAEGVQILAGNGKWMEKMGVAAEEAREMGTKVYVAVEGIYAGCVVIADEIKKDSRAAIAALKGKGVRKAVMLTGDHAQIADEVAKDLRLDEVYSELLPQDKVEKVESLSRRKRKGGTLAFVGDGINDAPVLAMADVGVAMGALGSDAAIEAADVVLMTDEPAKLAEAVEVARFTKRVVWQNIVFALGVKGIFLLLGALGVATMWEAVFADVGVALLAVLNAMRVMRK